MKHRKDIQVLRGIAVLSVILFHAYSSNFSLGYLGVDAFFVISGFVITPLIVEILNQESNSLRRNKLGEFYLKRFFRLGPALATTLIISAVLIFFLGPANDLQRFAEQGIATLLLLGNFGAYLFSGDYFAPNPNPLVHMWSLSVEEQIYVLLPIFLIFLFQKKFSVRTMRHIFLGITLLSIGIFLSVPIFEPLYSKIGIQLANEFNFYSPLSRIWQFTLGGLLAFFGKRSNQNKSRAVKYIKCLLNIILVTTLFSNIHLKSSYASVLVSLNTIAVIYFRSIEILPKNIRNKLEWVGDRSYSIYLIHMPIIYIFEFSPISSGWTSHLNNMSNGIALIATIILGALSFRMIESKFRIQNYNWERKFPRVTIAATLIFVLPASLYLGIEKVAAGGYIDRRLPTGMGTPNLNWDKSCQFFSTTKLINSQPCRFGPQNSRGSLMLIGDSHAAVAARSIIDVGTSFNLRTYVFTFQGCGFVLDPSELDPKYDYPYISTECIAHNKSILNFIETHNPDLVILGQRSSSIMVKPNNLESRISYKRVVAENLNLLREKSSKLILIGSAPELVSTPTWISKLFHTKSFFSEIPLEDNKFWGKWSVNGDFVDTTKIFCPRRICINRNSSGWLFYDTNHLSESGMKLLMPEIMKIIDRTIK